MGGNDDAVAAKRALDILLADANYPEPTSNTQGISWVRSETAWTGAGVLVAAPAVVIYGSGSYMIYINIVKEGGSQDGYSISDWEMGEACNSSLLHFQTAMLHEFCHVLGMDHTWQTDCEWWDSVMKPPAGQVPWEFCFARGGPTSLDSQTA